MLRATMFDGEVSVTLKVTVRSAESTPQELKIPATSHPRLAEILASVADWVVRTVSTLLTARRSERTVTLFEEAGCQLPSLTLALTLTIPGASPVMLK